MKKMLILLLVVVFAASMAFVGTSCKKEAVEEAVEEEAAPAEEAVEEEEEKIPETEPYTVGYLVPNSAEGQVMFMNSFRQYAEEEGMEVIDVNADNNVEKQDRQFSDLISQGVDALVVVPVDSKVIVASIERATGAGIPVFGVDRQPFSSETVMTVMSNNYLAGQQAAKFLVDRLTEKYGESKGIVLEVTGDLGTNVAQLRGSGFNDKMAEYPNIEVITEPTDWLPETGADVVQNAFTVQPNIDAIYWHSDFTGAGIIPALDEIGLLKPIGEEGHIIICGIDGDPNALNNIRLGNQDATVNQPLLDFGILAKFVKMYLDGKELTTGTYEQEGATWSPAEIEESEYGLTMLLSTWMVTKENVDDPTLWGNTGN
ncbi:HTH-type transcriptional repressor PurR [subsurface metagenome]|nr:substrate-binding domain-containing protein [Clostridia bacterium]